MSVGIRLLGNLLATVDEEEVCGITYSLVFLELVLLSLKSRSREMEFRDARLLAVGD
jgi:hypothetical protein